MEQKALLRSNYFMHLDYSVSLGEVYSRFMLGLKEKRVLGNKCNQCGRMYVPPQPFCPICYKEMGEWVETNGEGTVQSFAVTYRQFLGLPKPPYTIGVIKIGDSAISMLHWIAGIAYERPEDIPNKIQIGMKVKPVWARKRKGEILDIAYFKLV